MTSRASTDPTNLTPPESVVPRPAPGTIERPRLDASLADGIRGPLTVLSAPAGYGKSVLVSTWAQHQGPELHVAYLSMRETDESPSSFWMSARDALRDSGLEAPDTTWAQGAPDGGSRVDPVARGLVGHGRPVVWIVDCNEYQLASRTGVDLHRLLEGCAGALRLVILTRADPPLPLHRHRLAGTITEIRAADLAFTAAESSVLMTEAGIELGPDDLEMLRSRTGGWPAGLRFAAMTIAGRADLEEAVADVRGDTGNVAAYLMSEVYARQPGMIRQFLLRTCVADTLDPSTVTALTGQPCDDRALEFLTGGNSFIEAVPGPRGTYRYQSLFREFLRSQLAFEDPELERELRRAAAAHLAGEGQVIAAVQHAVAAQDWLLASHLLVDRLRFGSLLAGGSRNLLRALFAGMPDTTPGPSAAVVRAALALGDYDRIRCARHLEAARGWLRADTTTSGRARSLAIRVLEAIRASLGPDLDEGLRSSLSAENALRLAADEDLPVPSDLVALVAGSQARVQLLLGDIGAARESLTGGVRAADTDAGLSDLGDALRGMLALTTALSGELRQADAICTRLVSDGSPLGHPAGRSAPAAIAALAWVRMDEYDLEAVEELLESTEASSPTFDARVVQPVLMLLRARLLSAQGNADLALAVLDAARTRPATTGPAGWTDRALWHEQVAVLLRHDRAEEALALARGPEARGSAQDRLLVRRVQWALGEEEDSALPPSESPGPPAPAQPLQARVEQELALGEWSLRQGDQVTGGEHVHRALRLAAPEHLRRPFHDADEGVQSFLTRSGRWSRWLEGGPGDGPVEGGAAGVLVDPLTKREHEVLLHLADLLTTEEIAGVMFVSVNTVRSHVRSVLRKLGASRRNEAVRRAWELGLLVPPQRRPTPVP